jgi:secondary thiamine-phosphate synthase enzyme
MRVHRAGCTAVTTRELDFVDLTEEVQSALGTSGIADGQVTVYTEDPSSVLIINERESGLWTDIRATLERLGRERPTERRALLGSASVVLPAVAGRLYLGKWQRLMLVELERPKDRSVFVQIVGE